MGASDRDLAWASERVAQAAERAACALEGILARLPAPVEHLAAQDGTVRIVPAKAPPGPVEERGGWDLCQRVTRPNATHDGDVRCGYPRRSHKAHEPRPCAAMGGFVGPAVVDDLRGWPGGPIRSIRERWDAALSALPILEAQEFRDALIEIGGERALVQEPDGALLLAKAERVAAERVTMGEWLRQCCAAVVGHEENGRPIFCDRHHDATAGPMGHVFQPFAFDLTQPPESPGRLALHDFMTPARLGSDRAFCGACGHHLLAHDSTMASQRAARAEARKRREAKAPKPVVMTAGTREDGRTTVTMELVRGTALEHGKEGGRTWPAWVLPTEPGGSVGVDVGLNCGLRVPGHTDEGTPGDRIRLVACSERLPEFSWREVRVKDGAFVCEEPNGSGGTSGGNSQMSDVTRTLWRTSGLPATFFIRVERIGPAYPEGVRVEPGEALRVTKPEGGPATFSVVKAPTPAATETAGRSPATPGEAPALDAECHYVIVADRPTRYTTNVEMALDQVPRLGTSDVMDEDDPRAVHTWTPSELINAVASGPLRGDGIVLGDVVYQVVGVPATIARLDDFVDVRRLATVWMKAEPEPSPELTSVRLLVWPDLVKAADHVLRLASKAGK